MRRRRAPPTCEDLAPNFSIVHPPPIVWDVSYSLTTTTWEVNIVTEPCRLLHCMSTCSLLDSPMSSLRSNGRLGYPLATLAALVLALVLSACFPVVTIETEGPHVETSLRVRPGVSGVLKTVRIPDPRPRGAMEVVEADGSVFRIPPGHYPPPGSCRIWFPNRPPGQQPAPGDCNQLDRRVPDGAYLVYG